MDNHKPVLGVTLYSFTNEWTQRSYTFGQLVERVVKLGLGPAVEVVGFQSFRTFPEVSDESPVISASCSTIMDCRPAAWVPIVIPGATPTD